jgi:hypothetical protein
VRPNNYPQHHQFCVHKNESRMRSDGNGIVVAQEIVTSFFSKGVKMFIFVNLQKIIVVLKIIAVFIALFKKIIAVKIYSKFPALRLSFLNILIHFHTVVDYKKN